MGLWVNKGDVAAVNWISSQVWTGTLSLRCSSHSQVNLCNMCSVCNHLWNCLQNFKNLILFSFFHSLIKLLVEMEFDVIIDDVPVMSWVVFIT